MDPQRLAACDLLMGIDGTRAFTRDEIHLLTSLGRDALEEVIGQAMQTRIAIAEAMAAVVADP